MTFAKKKAQAKLHERDQGTEGFWMAAGCMGVL